MRVLLDSNIWISFFISEGAITEVVDHCVLEHTVLISDWIFEEIERVLQTKFKFHRSDLNHALASLRKCDLVEEGALPDICPDADDNHVLAAAQGGNARCLVTGDKQLLTLKSFENIAILSPNAFWKFEQETIS